MTPDQADYVLAQMSVAWPGKPLSVVEVNYWVKKLEPYEFDHANDALTRLSDRAKFWPSWAEFKEFLDIEKRSSRAALPARRRRRLHVPEPSGSPRAAARARGQDGRPAHTVGWWSRGPRVAKVARDADGARWAGGALSRGLD